MMFRTLSRFLLGTLRGRLIVGMAMVLVVTMTLFVGDLTERQRAMLLDRQMDEASAMSQSLATSAAGWIAADDISGLQELVEVQRHYPEVQFAILADQGGRVLAATDKSKLGLYLVDLPKQANQTMLSGTASLVDVATPAVIGGHHVGWARIGIGQKVASEKLAQITKSGVIYALAALLIGSVIAWFMGRQITSRLYAVQRTIDAVRSGNRLARSKITGTDEAAVMAREFDAMLDVLDERDYELRANEERYKTLIECANDAVFIHEITKDGTPGPFLEVNDLACQRLGYSREELSRLSPLELDDPRYRDRIAAEMERLLKDGHAVFETAQIARDGRSIPVEVSTRVLELNGTRLMFSLVRDITERKQAEEAQRRLNRELRAISNCNQLLMRVEDEQTLLNDVCRIVCDEAGYRMAWVGYAENDDARTIRPVARAGVEDGYIEQAMFTWADTERGSGPTGIAIRNGQSACIQDFATEPQAAPWRDIALQRGYLSNIALPLKDGNANTFGTLTIYSTEPNAFTPEEIRLLEELAGDLAFGIVTLRTRAERRQFELQKEQYLRFFMLSTEAMCISDPFGCFKQVNPSWMQLTGYSESELISRPFLDFVHPEDRQKTADEMKQQVAVRPSLNFENRYVCKDGSVILLSWNAYFDKNDGVTYATARDITERKHAEDALRASEETLRSIAVSAQDAILMLDPDGNIALWNTAAHKMFGYSSVEVLGKDMHSMLAPVRFHEPFRQGFRHFLATGKGPVIGKTLEIAALRKDGTEFPVELSLSAVKLKGNWHAVGIVRDITARKQSEHALERANRALRTLSASNMTLVHADNEAGLLDAVCRLIVEMGGYCMAWVGFAEQDPGKTVRPVAQYGHDEGFIKEAKYSWADTEQGRSPTGTAIRTGTLQVNQNTLTNPAIEKWRAAAFKRGYQSSIALPLRNSVGLLGALTIDAAEPDAFNEEEVVLLQELASDLTFGIENLRTRAERDRNAYEHLHHEEILRKSLEQSIQAIAATVEARDPYTAGHERRVSELSVAIAQEMGLEEDRVNGIRLAASIHDLGKIKVPAEILSKPGKLTALEFMLIKIHPQAGYDILKEIEFPWPIADIVLQHHEKLDGSGYPQGLKDDKILIESRILTVADVMEAMASHRPYRPALGTDSALEEIERGRGSLYDPAVVDICLRLFREGKFAFSD